MILKLVNINKIQQASINLEGLTVIAGVNDTGKSTVGKTLFSLIKAIGNINTHNDELRRAKVTQAVQRLNVLYRHNEEELSFLKDYFTTLPTRIQAQMLLEDETATLSLLADCQHWIENKEMTPQLRVKVLKTLAKLKESVEVLNNPALKLKKEFSSVLEAEFQNSICRYDTPSSLIVFADDSDGAHLEISLENNQIQHINASQLEDISSIDATFIESPLYIHLLNTLVNARTLQEENDSFSSILARPLVNYHVKDLAQKLDAFRIEKNNSSASRPEQKIDITSITGGKFVYHSPDRTLYWEKDGQRYVPVNVASGIKAFGVMQMLLETQHINENKLLIWDEPENHLHPEWQIKFAQFLVLLSKSGIPVLISSHSPYFIQAIRYFSNEEKLQKYVHYYLAEETETGGSNLEEVTDDLNRLFLKLAEPMNQIINLGV